MKSIEFDETQLQNLDELGKKLFGDENDPRSYAYKRVLNRPKINWLKILCCTLLPIMFMIGLGLALFNMGVSVTVSVLTPTVIFLVYAVIFLKKAIICIIRIYQRYAPTSIREKCRFEPSCSEYMILAIEKYGLIKGVKKGINRLKRCNTNDGGFDMP